MDVTMTVAEELKVVMVEIFPWVLFWHSLYRASQVLSPRLWSGTYPSRLSDSERDYWDASVVSSLHGVVISALGFYVLWTDVNIHDGGYAYESRLSRLCLAVVVGYLINDLYLGLTHLEWPGTSMMLFHHILGIVAMTYTAVYHFGSGMVVCIVVLEATSPFINFRWFFDKSGMKLSSPTLYLANGAMITVSWFALRICFYGYSIMKYVVFGWSELMSYGNHMHTLVVVIGLAGGYVLQVIWFKKIFAGLKKALSAKSSSKSD